MSNRKVQSPENISFLFRLKLEPRNNGNFLRPERMHGKYSSNAKPPHQLSHAQRSTQSCIV